MKRKIALVLCLALVAFTFLGCSQAELGYLNLAKEMSAQSYEMAGQITGEIDFDVLKSIEEKAMAKIAENEPYMGAQEVGLFGSMTGKKDITIHYTAKVKDSIALYGDFDVSMGGKNYPLGDVYFDMTDGAYVSKALLMGVYDLSKDLAPEYADTYFYSKEYRAELEQALGKEAYIGMNWGDRFLAADIEEYLNMTPPMTSAIYDDAAEFLKTAFSGFTTGAVSTVPGGYKITLSGQQMQTLLKDALLYVVGNIDQFMDAYKIYMQKFMGMMDLPEDENMEAEMDMLFGQEARVAVAAAAGGMRQALIEAQSAGYLDFMDGAKYEAIVKKSGSTYTQTEELSLKDGGRTALLLDTEARLTIKDVNIDSPAAFTSFGTVEKAVAELEEKYNPVKEASISWWKDSDPETYLWSWADIDYTRAENGPLSPQTEYDFSEYRIIDGNLYVPLRGICETFGETVTWDNAAKKAYVVRGGERIEMTGMLEYTTTFVKVRDFEKLGYTVSYSKGDYNHKVTISK